MEVTLGPLEPEIYTYAFEVDGAWKITAGAHEWKVWREHLAEFLPLLFRP